MPSGGSNELLDRRQWMPPSPRKADFEYLYDKPYEDNKKVRVAGPFTVESLSPHRVISVDEDGEWIDGQPNQERPQR